MDDRFDAVFRRLYPELFRYMQRMTGDSDVAEDAVQEAFVRLLSNPLPENEVRPWLFTVATNLVRDRARKVTRHRRLSDSVPTPRSPVSPERAAERSEQVGYVRAVLDEIPERDRTLLLMREQGFKYEEMARAVGVAPGSIGTLLARAARRFEKAYHAHHHSERIHEPSG